MSYGSVKTGDRVELVSCSDPYTLLDPGEKGVVDYVDPTGTVFVRWENGSRLGLIEDAGDRFRLLGNYGSRPIADGRLIHRGTEESGNLRTVCGLDVRGWWWLVDYFEPDCVGCRRPL